MKGIDIIHWSLQLILELLRKRKEGFDMPTRD